MAEQIAKVLQVEVPGVQGPAWIVGPTEPYSPDKTYVASNAVLSGGRTWRALADVPKHTPPPAAQWELIAEGGPGFTQSFIKSSIGI